MQDNFNIYSWKLKQAINELEQKQCPDCGCKMEGTMCNECGYMEEGATFTDKHDDSPELKGGQKKLPDELQAQILKKETTTPLADLYDLVSDLVAQGISKDKILDIINSATAKPDGSTVSSELDKIFEGESNLTPLQQYIYDYEVEISGDNFANKELENIKKLNNIEDVVKYYGGYRGWAADKDLKPELVSLFKTLKGKKLSEGEGKDHEVAMAKSSLQAIMGACSKLMIELGDEERNIPGWIQDHIAKAENYIEQAAQGFHELESPNDDKETVDEMFVGPRKYQTYMPDEWNYSLLVKLFDEVFGVDLQDEKEGKYISLGDLKTILYDYGATHFQSKDIHGNPILPRLVSMLKDKGHIISA